MSKLIRITISKKNFTFYGFDYVEEVHYRKTESETLELIRSEYAKDFIEKNFKIEYVDFDKNDKKSIDCFIPEKKNGKSKKNPNRNC